MPRPAIGQAHELARRHREDRAQGERHEPVRVEEPDAEEEQRDRERHGMDRTGRARGNPRVGEVAEREEPCSALGSEMPAAEPEDGERAERHDRDLRERQRERRRPDEPKRREQHEERIHVTTEPGHLLAGRAVA